MSGLSLALLVAAASKWTVLDGVCPDYDRYSAGWADYTGDFQKVEDCEAACNSHNCSTFTFNHHVKPGVCQGYAPRPPSCRALPGVTPHTHTHPPCSVRRPFPKKEAPIPGGTAARTSRVVPTPCYVPSRRAATPPISNHAKNGNCGR